MFQGSAVIVAMAVAAAKALYNYQWWVFSTADAVAEKTISKRGPEGVTALWRKEQGGGLLLSTQQPRDHPRATLRT